MERGRQKTQLVKIYGHRLRLAFPKSQRKSPEFILISLLMPSEMSPKGGRVARGL